MKKYIVLYEASQEAMKKMKAMTPDDQKNNMQLWIDWFRDHSDIVIDMGPIGEEQTLNSSGDLKNNKEFTGFSIIQAENIESLSKLLKGHPHFAVKECNIKIQEIRDMPK